MEDTRISIINESLINGQHRQVKEQVLHYNDPGYWDSDDEITQTDYDSIGGSCFYEDYINYLNDTIRDGETRYTDLCRMILLTNCKL
jgi:hypothetical protein